MEQPFRGPRPTRGTLRQVSRGGGNHHQQQPRMMGNMAWHNNAYPPQDEGMTPYQQPVVDGYQGYPYPHGLPSPDMMQNTQTTYPAYHPAGPCYVAGPPQMYTPMEPHVYMSPQPIHTPPPPSTEIVTKKTTYNNRNAILTCSNCKQINYFAESELIKKDEEIGFLRNQSLSLQCKVQELEEELQRVNSNRAMPEVSPNGALQPMEDYSISAKVSQLSPEAEEFSPKNMVLETTIAKVADTIPAANEVPVVSAKVMNEEPVYEAQNEFKEEEFKEESIKNEFMEADCSPDLSEISEPATSLLVKEEPEDDQSVIPEPSLVNEEPEEIKPEIEHEPPPCPDENTANSGQQTDADENWDEQSLTVNPNVPESTFNAHDENNARSGDPPFSDRRNSNFDRNNRQNRRRGNENNYGSTSSLTGFGRGKPSHRKHEHDSFNDRSQHNFHSRNNMNDRGHDRGHGGRGNGKFQSYRNNQKYGGEENVRDTKGDGGPAKDINEGAPRDTKDEPPKDTRENSYSTGGGRRWEHQSTYSNNRNDRSRFNKEDNRNQRESSFGRDRQNDDQHYYNKSHAGRSGEEPGNRDRFSSDSRDFKRNDNRDQNNGNTWNSNRRSYQKNIIKELRADLFSAPTEFSLAHCVAKDFRMGSGIAVKFRTEFKRVGELLEQNVDVGGCAYLKDENHDRYIFYMVTKLISNGKPTYDSLRNSLTDLREKCKQFSVTKLAIPRIGCGLDKLEWPRVRQIINEVFQDADIIIHAYEFNVDGLPESEGNKPNIPNVWVKHQIMNLPNIDAQTGLIFLGTEDGHMDSTAVSLNTKFKFINDYKKAPKTEGQVWCYDKLHDYYIYGLIVSKTFVKDKVSFSNMEECCKHLCKMLRKHSFEFIGMEPMIDWSSDNTFTEKVVTLLRFSLPKPVRELWVCYRDQKDDPHDMCKKGPNPSVAKHS